MPNDYAHVRAARGGPKITMGKGMHRVEPGEGTHEATPEEIRGEAIKNRGGLYSDRIKIEPKIQIKPTPKLSDTEIQKIASSRETNI